MNEKRILKSFEIYFDDLKKEAQEALLDFYGFKSQDEMNWNIVPLAVLETEEGGGTDA